MIETKIRERLANMQLANDDLDIEFWATDIIDNDAEWGYLPKYNIRINSYLRDVIERATMKARIERHAQEVYEQGCDYIVQLKDDATSYVCMLVDDQREVVVTTVDPANSATWTTRDHA